MEITGIYVFSGFMVGMLVGMTGVGGGSLMTPLLVLLLGVQPAVAVVTDLLYAGLTKLTGTGLLSLRGTVEWRVVLRLAAGSVPAAIATVVLLAWIGVDPLHTGHLISATLGVALVASALAILFRRQIQSAVAPVFDRLGEGRIAALTVLTGVILGVLVAATSVGAGALGALALAILYPRMPVLRLVGSDIAHAVPLTLVAGAGHWWLGTVDVTLLASLLCGSIPGILLGSSIAARLPERALQGALAVTIGLVGVKLIAG